MLKTEHRERRSLEITIDFATIGTLGDRVPSIAPNTVGNTRVSNAAWSATRAKVGRTWGAKNVAPHSDVRNGGFTLNLAHQTVRRC